MPQVVRATVIMLFWPQNRVLTNQLAVNFFKKAKISPFSSARRRTFAHENSPNSTWFSQTNSARCAETRWPSGKYSRTVSWHGRSLPGKFWLVEVFQFVNRPAGVACSRFEASCFIAALHQLQQIVHQLRRTICTVSRERNRQWALRASRFSAKILSRCCASRTFRTPQFFDVTYVTSIVCLPHADVTFSR